MKKQQIILFITVLALIVVTAGVCIKIKNSRKLGEPGLKLVKHPMYDTEGNVIGLETIDLPDRVLNYRASTNLPVTSEELGWLPADTTYGRRLYQANDNFGVLLSIVMMGVDSRSIHKPEICLPGQGWKIETSQSVTLPIQVPHPYDLPLKKITASKEIDIAGRKQTVKCIYAYWFVADDELASEHLDRMWKMGRAMVTRGVLQRWSYVACMAQCLPGQEDAAYTRLAEFIGSAVPHFQLTTGKPRASETASLGSAKP